MKELKSALITGASSGLGISFAKQLANECSTLILTARSADKMEKIAEEIRQRNGIQVFVVPLDLSVPGSAQQLFQICSEKTGLPDVLINNAGFGYQGYFENSGLQTYTEMMQLNMNSLTELCFLFGTEMIKNKRGWILNVSSVAGSQPVPYFSVYAATKAYVTDFSVALATEWRRHNVVVSALCPGPVDTNFFAVSGANPREMMLRKLQTPDEVVRTGVKALKKGKAVVVSSWRLSLLVLLSRCLSPVLTAKIISKSMKPAA